VGSDVADPVDSPSARVTSAFAIGSWRPGTGSSWRTAPVNTLNSFGRNTSQAMTRIASPMAVQTATFHLLVIRCELTTVPPLAV